MEEYDINTVIDFLTLKDYIDNNRLEYEAKRDAWFREHNLDNNIMKNCRVCGYITKQNVCPECHCDVMIDKDDYNWEETSKSIDWSKIIK